MIKPGSKDKKAFLLIAGEELTELKRMTWLMSESFALDTRIENYRGKRPIGLYSWDFECLLAIIDHALKDGKEYSDKTTSWIRRSYTIVRSIGFCQLSRLLVTRHAVEPG